MAESNRIQPVTTIDPALLSKAREHARHAEDCLIGAHGLVASWLGITKAYHPVPPWSARLDCAPLTYAALFGIRQLVESAQRSLHAAHTVLDKVEHEQDELMNALVLIEGLLVIFGAFFDVAEESDRPDMTTLTPSAGTAVLLNLGAAAEWLAKSEVYMGRSLQPALRKAA